MVLIIELKIEDLFVFALHFRELGYGFNFIL
jgi:hypothetical protein